MLDARTWDDSPSAFLETGNALKCERKHFQSMSLLRAFVMSPAEIAGLEAFREYKVFLYAVVNYLESNRQWDTCILFSVRLEILFTSSLNY